MDLEMKKYKLYVFYLYNGKIIAAIGDVLCENRESLFVTRDDSLIAKVKISDIEDSEIWDIKKCGNTIQKYFEAVKINERKSIES